MIIDGMMESKHWQDSPAWTSNQQKIMLSLPTTHRISNHKVHVVAQNQT